MTTSYPRYFVEMLYAFLDGWRPYVEGVDYQHIGKKTNPVTGRSRKAPGPWIPCRSLTELIGITQRWPVTDNYITAQRFTEWETRAGENGRPGSVVKSVHNTPLLDRIYTDTDPIDGEEECLDYLPRFKRMQDELEVGGQSAVWINCSGRGYHSYTYLDRNVDVREGRLLQDILGYVYDLELDYWAPITRARMMRLPYSKNSRTGTWVLCVGRNMTLGGLRNAMKSDLSVDGCHWDSPVRVTPERILALDPGVRILSEYREHRRERAREKIRRRLRPDLQEG